MCLSHINVQCIWVTTYCLKVNGELVAQWNLVPSMHNPIYKTQLYCHFFYHYNFTYLGLQEICLKMEVHLGSFRPYKLKPEVRLEWKIETKERENKRDSKENLVYVYCALIFNTNPRCLMLLEIQINAKYSHPFYTKLWEIPKLKLTFTLKIPISRFLFSKDKLHNIVLT